MFLKCLTQPLTMSTLTAHTNEDNSVVTLTGKLTFDLNKMMNELGDRHHFMFGDIRNLIPKLSIKLLTENIIDLYNNGTTMEFYDNKNIWCYLCVRPSDYANYMFSPVDSENRDNNFSRIREGVTFFYNNKFDVYIMPSS